MKRALLDLKNQISSFKKPNSISEEKWNDFTQNTTVALMAGGVSSRFQEVSKDEKTNKNVFTLPNGDTMIEMAIKMYRDAGINNFVALVYHAAGSVEELLGNGSKYGVKITYSHDPKQPVGKGGAVLNALLNGSIPRNHNLIVHNPDDVIVNYEGSFPKDIAVGHLNGVEQGKMGTVVVVEGTPYSFTGMKVVNSEITQIEMYPTIPIPTHIGVTVFSPEVYNYFEKIFDLTKKNDFEKVLFPILSKENKLYAVSIPSDAWIAVNNAKSYTKLAKLLEG